MTKPRTKRVNLALQGGGAHGAFTWGVLDALLEDGRLEIAAISGASAGAMNAVALADGWRRGGADGARERLRAFWKGAADAAGGGMPDYAASGFWSPLATYFGAAAQSGRALGLRVLEAWSQAISPYDANPFNWNPLRDLIAELVDFKAVRECELGLFVSATDVESGRVHVFRREELTADHVMASACLPHLYQAVTIDGVPYWDGGFMGNPPLFPFFYESDSRDVLIVQINPIERKGAPKSAAEIVDRLDEITFNASLLSELRAIEFVGRMVREGRLDTERYKEILIHRVDGGAVLSSYGAVTRLSTDMTFYEELCKLGRDAAKAWLGEHWSAVGQRSTVDLPAVLRKQQIGGGKA